MTFTNTTPKKLIRDIILSLFIYALPVVALVLWFQHTGETPWINNTGAHAAAKTPAIFNFIRPVFTHLRSSKKRKERIDKSFVTFVNNN